MTTYQEILETLQVQLQLNIELLNLAKEKTQILKDNDTSRLMAVSQQEERLVRSVIDARKKTR
jgi:FlgN protein.